MLQQIVDAIGRAIGDIIAFLPLALAFLAILLVGYFVARGLAALTNTVLERVGFDRWVERGGVGRAMARTKYDASDIPAILVFWATLLFTVQLAFGIFGPNPISAIINGIIGYLPEVFAATLIVVIGAAIAAAVREVVDAAAGALSYGKLLGNVAAGAVLFVTAFAALDQLNIAPLIVTGLFYAVLAAIAGILIVAVGGGGVTPMRDYWQRALATVEREAPNIQMQTQGASQRVRERAEERGRQAEEREVEVQREGERPQRRQPMGQNR